MAYGYNSNKRGRKQSRSKTKQLELRRILASLTMAAGILASPFSVGEAAIVRKEGTGPAIAPNGNVYNIDPEGSNGNFAYNRFKEFNLPQNQIANLKFDNAATLANLVNNKVQIDGIVNAVKGSAIDGHLIFLSPQGIAVGSTGVINAGQFTGIVPTKDDFDKLYNANNSDASATITQKAVEDIQKGAYATGGTINISGHINTHSGVMLGAGIININDGARIQSTKNLDFKDLVNIQNGASANLGTLTKVEGSGGDIILSAKQVSDVKDTKTVQDTNNQETTEAHAIRWSERSTDLNAAVNIGTNDIGTNVTPKGVSISSSDGAVKITAESTSTYKDSTPMTLTGTMKTAIFGSEETAFDGLLDKLAAGEAGANKYLLFNYSNKKNKSAVNIGTNSTITGNSIDVAANSKVEIKQSVTVPELPIGEDKKDSNGNVIPSGSKVLSTVTVSRVDNKADIVVDGNLKATGADKAGSGIKIAANADTKVELAAGGNGGDANAVAVGVAVLAGDTKANVVVNDKVTENAQPGENDLSATAGKVSVEATTGSDIDVNVVAKGTQSYVVSNVGVANYDTNADVTMNRNITAGAVDIKAENKITGLKLTVDNTVNPLVALLTSKDTAKLNDTQQTEDNNAAAGEQNSGQKSIDPTKVMGDASVDTSNTQDTQTQDAAGAIQKVKNAVEGTNGSGSGSSGSGSGGTEPKTSAFGLGASVGVFSNKNDAKVTIAKNVAITATKPTATTGGTMAPDGSVNISAKTIMSAFKVDDTTTAGSDTSTTGGETPTPGSGTPTTGSEAPSMENENSRLQFKVKNTLTNAKVKIGAAVLVSNVKNDATVVLDSDGTNAAKINGGAVSLNAAAGMEKYPVPPEKEDGEGADAGTGAGSGQTTSTGSGGTGNNTGSTESGDGGDEPEEKIGVLTYTVSAEGTSEEPSTLTLSGSVGINTLKNNAIVLLGQNSEVTGSEVKLSSDATTGAVGLYGPKELSTDDSDAPGSNAKVGIGASVGIQNIRGNSLVIAGKGVKLTGTESLEVSANNGLEVENKVQKAGKGDSVGISGMVALSYGDSNSIVSIDDEAAIAAGFTTITSTNSTNIDNSARTESKGSEGAKAFGIGVGIINYDINSIAMVGDNGSGLNAPTVVDAKNPTDTEKAAQKIYEDTKLARDVAGSTLVGKLGASTASGTKGTITTGGLVAAAVTTGMIQNDAKANATAAPKEKDDEDSEKWTKWSKQGTEGANAARTDTENLEQDNVESQNESDAPSASAAGREAGNAASGEGGAAPSAGSEESGTAPNPGSEESAGASIGIEGSAALTFLGGRTDAVLDNVTIQSVAEGVPAAIVSLSATDFLGSITLGGTSVKNKLEEGDSATEVGIGGTFAMSSSKRDVDSVMRNTDIPLALIVSNSATKIGIEVAAGLGVSTSSGDGTNVAGAGVVYYNKAKQDVHALMLNDTITGLAVSNQATGTDFQIAGGIATSLASGSGTNVGAGGTVAISHLENNLSSGIVGGNYNILSLDVEAQKGTTQINGALAGGKSGYGFEGAFAYGSIKNATHAYISDGANVTSLLPVSAVNVKAGEIPVVKTKEQLDAEKAESGNELDIIFGSNDNPGVIDSINDYDNGVTINMDQDTRTAFKEQIGKLAGGTLENEAETQKKNKETLEGTGIDTTGKSYLDTEKTQSSLGSDSTDTDGGKIADEAAGDEDKAKDELGQNRSITITAAMAGALGSEGEGGAGIAYNYVKNDIAADIKGSTITAGTVNGEAATDSLIVSVGAGIAVGGKSFNGAGSGSWNDLKNDTKVNFENNTIIGKNISEKAQNSSSIINIAGEVAGGKGMAIGLSLAYNSLNNTTGTYLKGNAITLQGTDNSVKLATTNLSKALAVAGGVDVNISQSFAGAVGTVAINRGVNNTESVIDGKTTGENTKLDNVKELSVTAAELAKKTTVAGGISVGGKKVGIGGAVAYASTGSKNKKEKLLAEINHADITTTADGAITVSTVDSQKNEKSELEKSRITTVGAGIGVGWGKNWFNLQGAAAVSDIYKDNRAYLNNTSINAKEGYVGYHPTIDVMADTKSKINTVGAVGNISITGKVTGTVGIAINRMDQDTKAEMATDDGKTTTVNAGLTQVRATGDGDIHSVGVGATVSVGEYVTAAGSGSYNYIGNDVDAIIQNQNLTSNSSVGVVAQSDDRLYNFAGGFNIGANTRAALGTAVSTNKITGSTNALMSGGSVTATDSGSINVTRPKDDKIFKAEELTVAVTRDGLSSSRRDQDSVVSKTGIVVDSSATHTIISQLSSGGVAASSTVGVNLAGTVNINSIQGESADKPSSTTAKIQDTNINLNSNGNASNVNVNAVDYTNFGSFTGTPAVGAGAALGVSLGVSANWETYDRKTVAEISSSSASAKKNVYAKDLTVDATAKHGSSALSFAAAAGGAKVGVASGDSIMRHKNTSTISAKLDKVNAYFYGKSEIKAEHLGNSHTQNIAATVAAGMVAVAAGAGVSVMDDTSTVKAEVADSILQAKSTGSGKDISVLAKNENNWKNTLVTASLGAGLGAGLAANVGIYNTAGETAALVTNSDLEAYDVNVNATDKLTARGTGGVGAGGVGGVGVAVTLNNINSSVSAHVTNGSVKASNNIDVKAEEERSFDSQVTGVGAGGIGVNVNVAVTSINKGITEAQLSNAQDENGKIEVGATTQNEIRKYLNGFDTKDDKGKDVHVSGVNEVKGALGTDGAKFYGMNNDDMKYLETLKNMSVNLDTPTYDSSTPDTRKQGVHAAITDGASLTAGNNVNVTAKDTSDISAKNVGVTAAGAASVNVTDAIIHTNYDTDVTLTNATVTGKNVNINALQTQKGDGSKVGVTAVTVGALGGVGVGYAGIVNRGSTDVNITGSTIGLTKGSGEVPDTVSAENVTINATDESKHRSDILSVGVAALNVTTTFASVENYSNVGVTLNDTKDSANNIKATNISATKNITIDAKKANALEAHTQGVGVGGINVAVNHATIEDGGRIQETSNTTRDTGLVTAKITGTNGTFSANTFHLGAANDTTAKLSAGNTAVSVLGVSRMRGKGVMTMGADVNVAGGTFNAQVVDFSSQLGNNNGRTLEGNVKGHNISAVAVAPDAVILNTTATGKVNVANSTFAENTNLILSNTSFVDRKAYIYSVTAGAVAVGNTSADIVGTETLTSTLTGKNGTTNKLAGLQVGTYGENTGKAFADAGGGGLVSYVGAHVDNKSTNTVKSTLSGKWDVQGEVYLVAAQKDETRLTASEGHGGIAGVGGTSVDNSINTTTDATIEENTEITADRVHVGTANVAVTGAYDDTNEKGVKDAQTYTMKDHFGGVISGNRLRSLVDLTENGTVTIGANAKITTNNLQEYIAASDNDLTNLVQAKGGGAIAVTDAVSEFNLNIHNKVNVESGATLSNEKTASTEDIILAAYDNQTLKSQVDGTVYAGVVSPIVTKNNINMNRTSDVNVAGTIESGNNVGLYAGADEKGALSNLNADLKSGAYNYSVISITVPRVNYSIIADKGTVDVSGMVRSTKDINAIASGGKEEVVKDESLWNWAKGGSSTDKKFLTSSATTGTESDAAMRKSNVNVTGSLIAGTANPINVTIDGTVADGLTITADNNLANNRVKAGITEGTFDYANTLGERLKKLNELIAAYDGTSDATVMAGYIAERTRIQNEMESQGLVEKDANGKITAYLSSGRPVYYVEIPDIATSGGNINVKADDFIGTGILHANSAPSITIENKSDAYLKLNNILMGEQGGKIVYSGFGPHLQDTVIPPGAVEGNKKINEMNRNESGTSVAGFSEIYGVTNGEAAALKVLNTKTFSGDKTSTITVTDEMKQQMRQAVENDTALSEENRNQLLKDINNNNINSFTYTAIPDVEVNGKISNFYGQVEINNSSGNIRISGGTKDRPTGVEGKTVRLIAANGSIAQDYKEGIVNIDGDPEKYLETQAASMKNKLGLSTTDNDNGKNKTESYTRGTSTEATGYIAGRDVYVSAANINVNGLIQSGYKNYIATVTQKDLTAAQERPANRAAVVQNRTMYKVNEGGAKWNDTDKAFDYVPQVYWDPATKQLFVEDIDTAGGKVYLTGRIASTGQGRILAADGAAEITVTNNTALDMNVGKVLNNQREGVITIADTAKNTWTEYKKGQTRTITNYSQHLYNHRKDGDPYASATVTDNNGLSVGHDLTYEVQPNQTYSWVNGSSVEVTRTYQHYERRGFWGLVQTADETELKGWETDANQIAPEKRRELGLPEGAVITQGSNSTPKGGQLRLDGSTKLLSSRTFDRDHWVTRSGFLGWFKHIYDRWKVGTSTIMLYNYTLNASQPIKIGLIGADVGKIDIKSTNTNGGSINLTGNVANSNNLAKLTVESKAGGIFQNDNTTLKSEIVNLTAKDDIKNIHIASIGTVTKRDADGKATAVQDNVKLSAISTGKGDIDITVVGGMLENQSLPGNVEIVALKSQNGNTAFDKNADLGDVTLTANGNITQSGSGTTVEGRGITLTSKNGGIGTKTQAIQMAASDYVHAMDRSGAQVNASAKGSIYLTEASAGGDMRVGKIESKEGDVTLTVMNGGFIDALPSDSDSGSMDSVDEMVHRWIDAGLIDGEKDAKGNYTYKGAYITGLEKNRDDYKANVEAAYTSKTQAQWQAEYADQQTAVTAIYNSTDYHNYLSKKAQYDALSQEARKEITDTYNSETDTYGNADYDAYVKAAKQYSKYANYATADAYLKDTAAYKYSQYANADDYLKHDATYKDLDAKATNPTFEWTKDMMLYAVSDALVNKASGESAQTKRAANVLGNNVTLTATRGVGSVSDQTTEIKVDDLTGTNQIENMKKLMNVDASDVKAVRENGNLTKFVITPNMPLGVKATGTLNVQAGGDVSVAGRTDTAGGHSAINVGTVNATNNNAKGDVRLYSAKGIYNALDANHTNIKGHNLLLVGGEEEVSAGGDEKASIGTSDKPLTVSLTGDLTEARASENVFIKNMKQNDYLRVGAMFARDTISLNSDMGFKMSANDIAESYINAGKNLVFQANTTTGIVGEANNPIRILNDRASVNITAGSAYIRGMGSISQGVQNGTLLLGTINTTGEFVANSDGSLAVGREEDSAGNTAVTGSVNAGGNVTLTATDNLTLDGVVKAGNPESTKKTLTLKAVNGTITQTDKGAISADTVKTFSNNTLLLENTGNQFNSIIVDGIEPKQGEQPAAIAGDVRIKDNSDALTVAIKRNVTGDISVENLRASNTEGTKGTLTNNGNLTATGNISLAADGNLTQAVGTALSAGENVNLTSTKGDVSIRGDISTGMVNKLNLEDGKLQEEHNALVIRAGGAIREDALVTITTPVVETYSGKGVSMESTNNKFAVFTADAMGNNGKIAGSVKATTSYGAEDNTSKSFSVGVGADIYGDAVFTNLHPNGGLDILILNPSDDNNEIEVFGGNGAEGSLILTASQDVNLLGDTNAAQDIVIDSTNGSLAGIGRGMVAGNDVLVSVAKGVYYMGGGVSAGNDIAIQAAPPDSQNAVIYIGSVPQEYLPQGAQITGDTSLTAGHEARFNVQGNGLIALEGSVTAGKVAADGTTEGGDVVATISGQGNVLIAGSVKSVNEGISMQTDKGDILIDGSVVAKNNVVANIGKVDEKGDLVAGTGQGNVLIAGSVESKNESVTVKTGEGRIEIGTKGEGETVTEEKTVTAKKDVTVETGLGTITIQGKTTTTNGDITMTAGKNSYQSGTDTGNFIIRDDGALISGSDITLNGRNGDIRITERIQATNGGIKVNVSKQGNVDFGSNVSVKDHVDISTDKGNIEVGKTITSTNGAVSLHTDEGAIRVGENITAENNVVISTLAGNITIGDTKTGSNGDVLSKKGDVSIKTDNGTVEIVKTVTAEEGNVKITSGQGDIRIGSNGPENNTVTAKKDVTLKANEGKILVQGKTSATNITVEAIRKDYVSNSENIAFANDGKLEAGNDVHLIVTNGDLLVTDDVTAKGTFYAQTKEKGHIALGNDLTVQKDLSMSTEDGDIVVGQTVKAEQGAVSMQTGTGAVTIGYNGKGDVTAEQDIKIQTGNGAINVDGAVTSDQGAVSMETGTGAVTVKAEVSGAANVTLKSGGGNLLVGSSVTAGNAANLETKSGNVVIGDNGKGDVTAEQNIRIQTGNGKIGIAGAVTSEQGDVSMETGTGAVTVDAKVSGAANVTLKSGGGELLVGADVTAGNAATLETKSGPVIIGYNGTGNLTAEENIKIQTGNGKIGIAGAVTSEQGDVSMETDAGNVEVEAEVSGAKNVTIKSGGGELIVGDDVTAGNTADIETKSGNVVIGYNGKGDLTAEQNIKIQTGKGEIGIIGAVTSAQGDVSMQTDAGNVVVEAEVKGAKDVTLKSGDGSLLVGADVTAGNNAELETKSGSVVIGYNENGNLKADQDINIRTDEGDVLIVKSVDSTNGSIGITSGQGDIYIGTDNVKDDKTVTAKENVTIGTDLGTIYILGMTSTQNGDITMSAGKDSYLADEGSGEDRVQNGNFVIRDDGKVNSGGGVILNGRNGDIHITDDIEAKKGVTANITEEGSVYFDREVKVSDDVNVTTENGSISIGNTVSSEKGTVNLQTGTGDILVGNDITAEKDVLLSSHEGNIVVGDINTGNDGDVLSKTGKVSIQTGEGIVGIVKTVTAQQGSIDIQVAGTGGVIIGNNGPDVKTVTAKHTIDIGVDLGQIKIYGKTSTEEGDISMTAGSDQYTPGDRNFIIEQNGVLESGRDINLTGRNGDLLVSYRIQANRDLNAVVLEKGGVFFDESANLKGDVTVQTEAGPISIAGKVDANSVDLSTEQGDVSVGGDMSSKTWVNVQVGTGNITTQNINANDNVNVTVQNGDVRMRNAETGGNANVTVGQGDLTMNNLTAGGNADVTVQNGDIRMHDVTTEGNTTINSTSNGSINGNNIVSGGTTHVALTNGDLFLNLAEGKAVVLRMENNTAASRVNTVLADASGGAGSDVELTGNYIPIGTIAAKGGNSVLQLSAMGAGNQKLISGEISVGSLRSANGTHMPYLWTNRGYVHVDEGNLGMDDVLAVDKIHLENNLTDLAIYGRIPTRDGEQLAYWNNLGRAYSKTRPFDLYTDGKVRTHRSVLVDAGRYYGKLYGDNLSVVDMKREWLTYLHGQFAFDSTQLTKPGETLRDKVLFGMEAVDADIRRHNASADQLL